MDSLTIIATVSIISATFSISIGSIGGTFGEAGIAREAVHSITQQPDESANITKVLFMSMAMVESCVIYCLVISMILIFANPFWSAMLARIN
ncbi:MAG TPA: F0F1 ATP synthase subunit C [Rickettsiales bacterium]|nr:F0F1 ATP synthase subunit C [Rickettsiales bacterium]